MSVGSYQRKKGFNVGKDLDYTEDTKHLEISNSLSFNYYDFMVEITLK